MSLLSSFSAKRGVYGGRAGLDVPPSSLSAEREAYTEEGIKIALTSDLLRSYLARSTSISRLKRYLR